MTEDLEERLIEGLGELKRLGQEMIRQQNITNGRVTKLEMWQSSNDLQTAKAEAFRMGRAEAFVTKKQMTVAVASIGTLAGATTTVATLIVRWL